MSPFAGPVPCPDCGATVLLAGEERELVACGCGRSLRIFRLSPYRAAPVSVAPPGTGTPCAYHAGNGATGTCERCGSFLCDLCVTPVEGKTYCTACFERLRAQGGLASLRSQLPRPHVLAAAVGLFSLVPLVGLAATAGSAWYLVKAWRGRGEIAQREPGIRPYLAMAFAALLDLGGVAITLWILL